VADALAAASRPLGPHFEDITAAFAAGGTLTQGMILVAMAAIAALDR
jgi:hypothetical protein